MGHLFQLIIRRRKVPPTVRHNDNNKKITTLVPTTKINLKTMIIIKSMLLKLRNYSCCLSFSLYNHRHNILKLFDVLPNFLFTNICLTSCRTI